MSGLRRACLSLLLLLGQTALLAHHHALEARGNGPALARHDAADDGGACRLCALALQTFAAHTPAAPLAAAPGAVFALADAASPFFIRPAASRSSCRAPPGS